MIGVISSPSSCRNIFHAKETWGEGRCRRGGCRGNHPGGSLQGFCVQECPPRSQSGSHSQSESTGEEMLKFLGLLRSPGLHLFFWHILLWTFLVLPCCLLQIRWRSPLWYHPGSRGFFVQPHLCPTLGCWSKSLQGPAWNPKANPSAPSLCLSVGLLLLLGGAFLVSLFESFT